MTIEDDEPDLLEATTLTMEGRSALAAGDGQRAYALLSKKHDIVVRAFGPNGGSVGTSLIDLAEALHLIGRTRDARAAINQALSIYEQLGRTDAMRDRLERALIEICTRQGHFFEVERIHRARLERPPETPADAVARAAEQDDLAMLLIQQGRLADA